MFRMTGKIDKVMIVEGITDKRHIERILEEPVTILCTYGTFSIEYFDRLLETYDLFEEDVYIFVDEDEPGLKLRQHLNEELSHAKQMHIPALFKEVAETPLHVIAEILIKHNFIINPFFINEGI